MGFLKGIDVVLHTETETGRDAFNRPITTRTDVTVHNVLVAPISQSGEEILSELSMDGKKARYQLAIPKGDTNNWDDATVTFFGETWRTVGFSTIGMDHLIPLGWTRKVVVERYG